MLKLIFMIKPEATTLNKMICLWKQTFHCCLPVILSSLTFNASADIVVDGSLNGQRLPLIGPEFQIDENLGQRSGENLFHSFETFNLYQGETAHFNTLQATQNIIARVTGGESSWLNGAIDSNSTTNLWMINPAGWMIGPNMQINLPGSFHLSSANSMGFSDGSLFFADPVSESVLSVTAPVSLQFTEASTAQITIDQADLIIADGQTLSLVGGDVNLQDTHIQAPGGRILLASNQGEGSWNLSDSGWEQQSGQQGSIHIQQTQADSFNSTLTTSNDVTEVSGGHIQIQGQQIQLDNALLIDQGWDGNTAGTVELKGQDIYLSNSTVTTDTYGDPKAGDIFVTADNLTLDNGSDLISNSESSSQGGNIDLTIQNKLILSNVSGSKESSIATNSWNSGDGGKIRIQGGQLAIQDQSKIQATANDQGSAGSISITNEDIQLNSGGTIATSTQFQGNGGDIQIQTGRLSMNGDGTLITATASPLSTGLAGNITIQSQNLNLSDQAKIRAENLGAQAAGTIHLTVFDTLESDHGLITTEALNGNGGPIHLNAETLVLRNAQVTTSVNGPQGNGGDIAIKSDMLVMQGGFIQANTAATNASGGNIQINSDYLLASRGEVKVGGLERQTFSPDSQENIIQAAAPKGNPGNIQVNSLELNVSGQLANLDSRFVKAQPIVDNPCDVKRGDQVSSLVQTGSSGLPLKAGDAISLPVQRHSPSAPLEPQSNQTLAPVSLSTSTGLHCNQEQQL